MRYRDLFESKTWRKYEGRDRCCFIVRTQDLEKLNRDLVEVLVQTGNVTTGKQRIWAGYFVQVVGPDEQVWLAEHPHFL